MPTLECALPQSRAHHPKASLHEILRRGFFASTGMQPTCGSLLIVTASALAASEGMTQQERAASVPLAIISDRPHHEQSQMITNASGRPIPTAPPITIANAKSKPVAACHDMLPFLCGSRRHARMTDQLLLRQVKYAWVKEGIGMPWPVRSSAIFGLSGQVGFDRMSQENAEAERGDKGCRQF